MEDTDKKKYEYISNNIEGLSDLELQEIFKILYNNKVSYTKNANGIFINLPKIDVDVLNTIYKYIQFCKESNNELNSHESMKKGLITDVDMKSESVDKSVVKVNEEREVAKYNTNVSNTKNRVSSTMKYYILKKKITKNVSNIDLSLDDELDIESI